MAAKQKPILYKGMGQPYLALFNFRGMPIMNPITGIPLGAYISTWSYRYDDIAEIQENQNICLQWGYIYPDGQFISGPIKIIKVREFEAVFDSTGTHVTIKCIDSSGDLRYQPAYVHSDMEGYKLSTYLDNGCGNATGVIIEIFQ